MEIIKFVLSFIAMKHLQVSYLVMLNPLNPIVHFRYCYTTHYAEKIASACWRASSASAERRWVGSPAGAHGSY